MRGASKRFLFFLSSVAIGVGAIVGIGNIASNFEAMTAHEARNLLAADLEVRLNGPLTENGESVLDRLAEEGVQAIRLTELIGMAANTQNSTTRLVELKAVERGYPFYGRLVIEPEQTEPFLDPTSVYVQEGLLIRLKLRVGDAISIGEGRFTIRGILKREPDRVAGPFNLGPRVLLSQTGLDRADLIRTGSRVRRKMLLKGTASWPPEVLKSYLETQWANESLRIKTYREVRPRLARFLENFSTYLGIVGLITLMIGGIGVGGNIHAFLTERVQTIAILKSLGTSATTLLSIYLVLALILGGIGGLLGIGLGMGVYFVLEILLSGLMPPDFTFQITFLPILQGMVMGLLTTLLFSLWPLRVIGEISPSRVFRIDVESDPPPGQGRRVFKPVCLGFVMIIGWIFLVIWQAGSWRLGAWVIGGVGSALVLLVMSGKGLLYIVKKIGVPRTLIFRYGLRNLYRPGRQVMAILISLGIGVTILLTLAQIEKRLMAQLKQNIPEDAPGLFLIDIQPDQKAPLEAILASHRLNKPPGVTPLIRSRLHAIDGKKISELAIEGRRDSWYFTREYVLTYQKTLPEHNVIQRGTWWDEETGSDLLSVEAEAAQHLGVDIGSEVTFDIQGVQVGGRITSVRAVDWGSMAVNFYFIFSPVALAGAPETYVATVTADPAEDLPIQNAVIGAFPNITVIPIREILETIARILTEISRTVRFMALLALSAGLIVVAGAIAASRARRVHEMVLFKTLGATRPDLISMMAVEYTLLGCIAAMVGGGLSLGLSWGIVRFFLEIPWETEWLTVFGGGAATIALTVLTGFITSYRILGKKPLAALRAE